MMYRIYFFTFFIVFSLFAAQGQKFYRIRSDFSIKTKLSNGTSQLVMGKVYYDKNIKKLVYQNTFPAVETWVSFDTTVFCIINNQILKRISSPPLSQFSIFHLALTSQISNYGLKNSMFKIQKVEKQKNMVITTWLAPFQYSKIFGKVLISNIDNKLYGIVFLDQKEKVLRKQFFNNYQNTDGLEFPMEIVDITYVNDKENYQVTTYKNIEVDKISDENLYNYSIPHN